MRRALLALSLSLGIHAALLALLPVNSLQPASREIIRVTLAVLPGGKTGDGTSISPAELPSNTPATERTRRKPERPKKNAPRKEPPKKPPQNESAKKSETAPSSVINATQPPAELISERGRSSGGRVPEGAGIVEASRLRVTKKVPAKYPVISRRRRDQGTVVLILSLKSGRVTKAEIEKSSGHSALDESAKRAVSAWEFDVTGFGESLTVRIPFVFSLTGP